MRRKNVIRYISAAAALVVLFTSCGQSAKAGETHETTEDGLTKVSIVAGTAGGASILPVVAAYGEFDKEYGIDFQLQTIDTAADTLAATESGKVEIAGYSSAAPLSYIADGHDLRIIGGLMLDYETIITTPENQDLWKGDITQVIEGKTIGVNRTNSGDIALRGWLVDQGVDLSKVTYKELDSPATVVEAVKKGTVDAGIINGGYYRPAEEQGLVNVRFIKEIIGNDFICCRQIVSPENAENNHDLYVKVEKALIKAYALYQTDHEKTLELAKNYIVTDPEELNFILYECGDLYLSPDPNIQGIYDYYEGMKASGYIDSNSDVDITQYVDTSIYKEALEALVKEEPDNEQYKRLQSEFKETATKA
ncbi:ABC transporter substrate-binding protein [uncultured Ruminococcus sp.]|uniref:ABC transporter substrate-binding protein n=1 Tax=uncultured Ruminococcus sp. TaxID=165186 RepID=UPI0025D4A124|nr:PhnD/SsuA/transferrin family substrate-binding protein [uncultured Ruminococcus sp.]